MASIQYSHQINQFSPLILRRSDRKKTKKIIKDDFTLPNPFKGLTKKHKSLRLPHNLDLQIKKIQYLTERSLAMLNFGKREFSLQILNKMKEAVNQQQNKLNEFLPNKLFIQKNHQQNIFSSISLKNHKINSQKQNLLKVESNNVNVFDTQLDKQVAGISTAEELYCTLSQGSNHNDDDDDNISAFNQDQDSAYCIIQMPRFRKQSSKLLSDNYENNQLFYTLDHIVPNWHKDQQMLNQQQEYLD